MHHLVATEEVGDGDGQRKRKRKKHRGTLADRRRKNKEKRQSMLIEAFNNRRRRNAATASFSAEQHRVLEEMERQMMREQRELQEAVDEFEESD